MSVEEADLLKNDGKAKGAAASTDDLSKLQDEIKGLEVSQATQAATIAGAQATQAAMHAATWSTMAAGAGGLIVGIFLGSAIVKAARR